jgi:cell division protein FtsI (penicillin-binding protein 3)
MAIGYELQVTPLQLAQAYAAFANDGTMMRPYLVQKIVDGEDNTVWKHHDTEVRQIAEKSTLKKLFPVFKGVVSDSGTAKPAQVKGLSIAGKTGTAQKFIDGRYRTKYRSSFVGFFPAEDPKYVCLVVLDDPETYPPYGGYTAGPIFKNTAKRIAGLDNEIEKEIIKNEHQGKAWAYTPELEGLKKREAEALLDKQKLAYKVNGSGNWIVRQHPKAGSKLTPRDEITLDLSTRSTAVDTTKLPDGYSIIPNVGGMSMRKATALLNRRGFEIKMIGSGTIYTQFPRPGDMMKQGRAVTVRGKAKGINTLTGK